MQHSMEPTAKPATPASTTDGANAAVAELAERLAAEARRMDAEFVRLTEGVTTVHGRTVALSGLGTRLAEQIGARLAAIRNDGVGQLVSGSYDALQRSLVASRARLTALDANHAALGELQDAGRRLKGIVTRLGVTRLGFSIECARLDTEESSFRDFVAQLVELERVVAKLGIELATQAGAARAEQATSGNQIRAALTELGSLAANCEAVARSATSGIEAMLMACGKVAAEVGGCIRSIETHSADLVYFLQFGDIVRQKIEHVAQALATASAAGPSGQSLAVQAAQVVAVRDELAAAGRRLDAAFRGLGECTDDLLQLVGRLAAVPQSGVSQGASLEGLLDELQGMHRLRRRADDLGAGSARTAAKAAEVAARLAEHLDSIHETNARMHMMALNAIVNTSRLGRSAAALSVLSIQVHEVAKDSSVIVGCVLPLLDRVRDSVQGMAVADETATEVGGAAAVEQGLAHLAELAAWVASTRSDGFALADAQRTAMTAARQDIGFLGGLRERLDRALRDLTTVRASLGSSGDGAGAAAGHAELLASYTMESERDVYRAVVGAGAAAGAATPVPAGAGSELGDNVELF